jgi:hypothetical protein
MKPTKAIHVMMGQAMVDEVHKRLEAIAGAVLDLRAKRTAPTPAEEEIEAVAAVAFARMSLERVPGPQLVLRAEIYAKAIADDVEDLADRRREANARAERMS